MQPRLIVFDLPFPSGQDPATAIHPAMHYFHVPVMGLEITGFNYLRLIYCSKIINSFTVSPQRVAGFVFRDK